MLVISGRRRVRDGGTWRSAAPPGERVLSLGAAARRTGPGTRDCPNGCTDSRRPGASPPSLPPGLPPPGPRVRACGRADAVTREGGVAATPLQVKRHPPAEQKRGQAVSMRHRTAIGPNRQASLRRQNYNAGSRCKSMATSREITSENAVQCISMRVCNAFLSACRRACPDGGVGELKPDGASGAWADGR